MHYLQWHYRDEESGGEFCSGVSHTPGQIGHLE